MQETLPEEKTADGGFRKWAAHLVRRHFKTIAWICFAIWLLTMYAVLFRMNDGLTGM
jgi:hypothetical protein